MIALLPRHLSIEKLAFELSKVKILNTDKEELASAISEKVSNDPEFASALLAAIKVSEDFEKGLVPPQFSDLPRLGTRFGEAFSHQKRKTPTAKIASAEEVNLPPFLKFALIELAQTALSKMKN